MALEANGRALSLPRSVDARGENLEAGGAIVGEAKVSKRPDGRQRDVVAVRWVTVGERRGEVRCAQLHDRPGAADTMDLLHLLEWLGDVLNHVLQQNLIEQLVLIPPWPNVEAVDDVCVCVGRDVDANRAGNLAVTAAEIKNRARTLQPKVELRRVG